MGQKTTGTCFYYSLSHFLFKFHGGMMSEGREKMFGGGGDVPCPLAESQVIIIIIQLSIWPSMLLKGGRF